MGFTVWMICDILWGHIECRVAHPLRLIAFDVGDTPRHCKEDSKDDMLLSGGRGCKVCELWQVAGAAEQPRPNRHIKVDFNSVLAGLNIKKNPQLMKYRGNMGYNIPSNNVL